MSAIRAAALRVASAIAAHRAGVAPNGGTPIGIAVVLLIVLASSAGGAWAQTHAPVLVSGSRLAYPALEPAAPRADVLAQRAIVREWGPPEGAVRVTLPGWRAEGVALALSAAAPGSGQAFVGEGGGWWYGVVEAIGWATHFFFERQARALREDSERIAGAPGIPASAWSFDRWERVSGGDASELESLYLLDREVFFDLIASDPRYLAGWDGAGGREQFTGMRDRSDARLKIKRMADIGLWTNHVLSAFDALRAARRHNRPIERAFGLRLEPRWFDREPVMAAAVERSF